MEENHNTEPPKEKKLLSDMVVITISRDKLEATMGLYLEGEEITATYEELADLLKKNNVTYGIDDPLLREIVRDINQYRNQTITIARGKEPEAGIDGRIEYLFKLDHSKSPKEREDGSVDYYSILNLLNVTKGELLAKKILPTPGTPGKSVTGEEIKAKDGKDARFQIGKNVLLDQEKMNAYSAVDGQISFTEKTKLNVFPVFEVNDDLDFSTGNIDFIGNVVIRGNIHPGFIIKAGGDVKIQGSVESATIEANGSIEILGGVIGRHKGYLKAGVDVKTGFIQEATITAENDVIVAQTIMHSSVSAGRDVVCRATKGLIVGGTVRAGEQVVTKIVGNMTNTPTTIEVGAKPWLRDEYEKLKLEIKEQSKEIQTADISLQFLDKLIAAHGQLPPDKQKAQIRFLNSKLLAEKKTEKVRTRIKEIEEQLNNFEKARIEASLIMYGGAKLVIGNAVRYIKENYRKMYFTLGEDGEITGHIL
ncbi:FapA family protein [Aneurinibacillus sp. Ricciae_BoGa-3]|uniref:DUF342 domain-containing protein n=1 Tax=Aneurinibacillus sp. Ricciae_BoGa-3 TaxID=3022697 RepID=UPI00234187B2|nr:FapA family protein [Aneurinibacillus sp. Ricciae_BoGa-3]WCK52871.1 FapA family protein [Aneurinibacillus sp. Ricciae_BoGa-3]